MLLPPGDWPDLRVLRALAHDPPVDQLGVTATLSGLDLRVAGPAQELAAPGLELGLRR